MLRHTFCFLIFVSASFLFAQTDANSAAVTACRSSNVQPDQIAISLSVLSGFDAYFDTVIAALQGSGVTAANFNGGGVDEMYSYGSVTNQQVLVSKLRWGFGFGVPLAKLKDTLAALTAVQQSIAKKNNGLTLNFSVQGMQYSPELLQSLVCKIPDVIADARAQAEQLADAAGLHVGGILAVSSSSSNAVSGSFGYNSLVGTVLAPPSCSATVKFALLRF